MERKSTFSILALLFVVVALSVGALGLLLAIVGSGVGSRGVRVGLVRLVGPIESPRKVVEHLWELADDDVVGLVLRIDSPGGSVGPSQEIYEAVARVREETGKPIVASMGAIAASGGYYAALGCDRIVANPGTITGSVGVIVQTLHAPELLRLAHVKTETVKSGGLKDSGSPFRDPTDADRALFEGMVSDVFDQFTSAVREARKLDDATFDVISDGRILSGRQAKELGLVDELGNLGRAGRLVIELAGEEGRPRFVMPKDEVPSWVRSLFKEAVREVVRGVTGAAGARVEYRAPVR